MRPGTSERKRSAALPSRRDDARRLVLVAGLAFALVLAGCGSGPPSLGTPLRPLGFKLPCGPIDVVDRLPPSYAAVDDVVAFPTYENLQRGRSGPDNDLGSSRSFSKFGLLVKSGSVFQLHVAGEDQANALIYWGNVAPTDPVSSIRVDGCVASCESQPDCPGEENAEWGVYPGGVWTLEPACITLLVLTEQETGEVRLPVGESCT